MTPLPWQMAAIDRQVMNYRCFIELHERLKRWPQDDVDRARRLLEALQDAAITFRTQIIDKTEAA